MSAKRSRDGLVTLVVLLLCGAILALFTDIETRAFRWVNCGPLLDQAARRSDACR
ncbi:MAG: hypothetical protein VKM01_04960 [Cyanobacteriota bacterium]|jgi:hypothetical protein|nr:hypothetical protein [Cyanobacteriota bacterium]